VNFRPERIVVDPPASLQPYVEYTTFSLGETGSEGVALKLTEAGVQYARHEGARELASWLRQHPLWQGRRTLNNVTSEIRQHAWFAHAPLISGRANPVDLEYFQPWPLSLLLAVSNHVRALLQRQ